MKLPNIFRNGPDADYYKTFLLSAYFFLVVSVFWVLKPLKKSLLLNHFSDDPLILFRILLTGAEVEQLAKVLNLLVSYAVVILFTYLAQKVPRQYMIAIFGGIFVSGLLFFVGIELSPLSPGWFVWAFYVFGDMFNMVMIGLFWSFTNDISSVGEARNTYGLIGLGGVLGGFVGATVVHTIVDNVGRLALMLGATVPIGIVVLLGFLINRHQNDKDHIRNNSNAVDHDSSVFKSAKLVLTTKYLLSIAGIIALYEVTSNIIDFQLASVVEYTIAGSTAKDQFFGMIGQASNLVSIVVQIFVTTHVMRKFGANWALTFLPILIIISSTGFLVVPLLFTAAVMSTTDNGLNYSINQTAKESLYTPTSPEVKYGAKAFIDMFVQRFAKVISVVLNLLFSILFVAGIQWLSVITIITTLGWLYLLKVVSREMDDQLSSHKPTETGVDG